MPVRGVPAVRCAAARVERGVAAGHQHAIGFPEEIPHGGGAGRRRRRRRCCCRCCSRYLAVARPCTRGSRANSRGRPMNTKGLRRV
eukprot:362721-Chlamydomonas_euryale.AAC.8